MTKKTPEMQKIDFIVGARIHALRLAMGMSRVQLAEKINITHQQLQKYEKGMNRICVARLMAIAKALRKHPAYFMPVEDIDELEVPTQHQRMCIEVSRNFMRIQNPTHQDAVNLLVRSLVEE